MNHLFPSPIVIINRRISWSFKVELLIASSSSNISIIQKVMSILYYIGSILYCNLNWKEKIHMNRPNCSIKKEIWLHYASRLQFTIKIVIEIMAMYFNGVKIVIIRGCKNSPLEFYYIKGHNPIIYIILMNVWNINFGFNEKYYIFLIYSCKMKYLIVIWWKDHVMHLDYNDHDLFELSFVSFCN